MIEPLVAAPHDAWLRMRCELWPHSSADEHLAEMSQFVADPAKYVQFMFSSKDREPLGFVEAAVRQDYVNGAETSPVAFLEGIYVVPMARRRGVARELLQAVCAWAKAKGLTELASDARLENLLGHQVHLGLEFVETERVVFFKRRLL